MRSPVGTDAHLGLLGDARSLNMLHAACCRTLVVTLIRVVGYKQPQGHNKVDMLHAVVYCLSCVVRSVVVVARFRVEPTARSQARLSSRADR